ncbi:hypothetical protein AB6A40_007405 [Gnathostoma spinigerum]|uniref:Chromo domain-containing protein n=1 Tax=Gnathostoma spinigerum TaxID=75299 RepID=A0ABD6ETB8_9BILA
MEANSDREIYYVEKIVGHTRWFSSYRNLLQQKKLDGGIRKRAYSDAYPFYLVKWIGYSDDENTWEPEENVKHVAAFDMYKEQLGSFLSLFVHKIDTVT